MITLVHFSPNADDWLAHIRVVHSRYFNSFGEWKTLRAWFDFVVAKAGVGLYGYNGYNGYNWG